MGTNLLLAALVVGAPALKAPPAETPTVVGEWAVVKTEMGGKTLPAEQEEVVYRFGADGRLVFRIDGRDLPQPPSLYSADPTAKPATIDLRVNAKGNSPLAFGLYRIDGDTLTMCLADLNQERPTELASRPGAKVRVFTFRRVKPR